MANNVVCLVAGNRGRGKTDFIKNEIILASPLARKLIVDTFNSDVWQTMKTFHHPENDSIKIPIMPISKLKFWKSGLYRLAEKDTPLVFATINEHLRNSLVVFEDATRFIG
jgi:hypothetical protein